MPKTTVSDTNDASFVLETMSDLSDALAGSYRPEQVVSHVASAIRRMFDPERAVLVGLHPVSGEPTNLWSLETDTLGSDSPVVARALTEGAFHTPDCWMAAPLLGGEDRLGALCVKLQPGRSCTANDLNVLRAVAAQAAMGLRNASLFRLLSEGKREWEQTVDAISQAFCLIDEAGKVRRINAAFSELVGVPVTTVQMREWIDLVPTSWIEPLGAILAGTNGRAAEVHLDKRIIQISALDLGDSPEPLRLIVFDDLTEKRELQDQVVQSAKMSAVGQLISGVAHELNNPLASVIGLADYLSNGDREVPAEIREPLGVIFEEAERAATIVGNLLGFARKHEHSTQVVSVQSLLESTSQLLHNQMMHHDVDLEIDPGPELPDLDINCNRIQQVLVNLITNAAQSITQSGTGRLVSVTATPWLSGVAITVSDDGPGIPDDIRDQIFEPFFTTRGEKGGTGLGLSICQGIIREHGGRLVLLDQPDRQGATFRIELPGSVDTVADDDREDEPDSDVGTARILVVDDEPNVRYYMRATLEAWGHEVQVARDPNEAMTMISREPFDVVLSDVRMPGMNGRDFYDTLVTERPEIADRVIFCTGDTAQVDTLQFLERAGRPYLTKPFTLGSLRATLASVIQPAS